MRLILDSNVLALHPAILARGGRGIKFLITESSFQELVTRRFGGVFSQLFERALQHGLLEILPPTPSGPIMGLNWEKLTTEDLLALNAALYDKRQHPDEAVYLVSDDTLVLRIANDRGLQTATSNTVGKLLPKSVADTQSNQPVLNAIASINAATFDYFVKALLVAVSILTVLLTVWYFWQKFAWAFNIWTFGVAVALSGGLLFLFRSRMRLSYGIVEVAVGLFAAIRLFKPSTYDLTFFFQLATSLYIIVRGLDNVEKGLAGTWLEASWKRIFVGRPPR